MEVFKVLEIWSWDLGWRTIGLRGERAKGDRETVLYSIVRLLDIFINQ